MHFKGLTTSHILLAGLGWTLPLRIVWVHATAYARVRRKEVHPALQSSRVQEVQENLGLFWLVYFKSGPSEGPHGPHKAHNGLLKPFKAISGPSKDLKGLIRPIRAF